VRSYSPLFESLTSTDLLLLLGGVLGTLLFLIPLGITRQRKLGLVTAATLISGLIVVMVALLQFLLTPADGSGGSGSSLAVWICLGSAVLAGLTFSPLPTFDRFPGRFVFAMTIALLTGFICLDRWSSPVLQPERFVRGQIAGTMENTYTLIPWSPTQSRGEYYSISPSTSTTSAFRRLADERISDGIGYLARTIVFNLSGRIEGLPLSRSNKDLLVEGLVCGCSPPFDALAKAGVDPQYIGLFTEVAEQITLYRKGIEQDDPGVAGSCAAAVDRLVRPLETAGRNSTIAISDALSEFRAKIPERIQFVEKAAEVADTTYGGRVFHLGTDPIGRDVLSQMLWACRLSISIGLVSTGISVLIGIIVGALMGYFGGWVDLVLSRILEIFMAVPVLFLLIVAASVLPRNTYVMMTIIGCVTWTGSARFIRAEFLKLRNQDFVQSCRAVGLPLHSTLFRHMLPNGVTPVLVQASFGVAAAIIAEATLSYLGLGPYGQPSWGKLLSLTTGETGVFLWWMAVFPGLAIFLTVLAYNVLGENFRDAIDPKMRKAAH
ncbi:MAG: ABC transporter permease, partial [Planctomycetota bacterium]|nr:ABC transporter permease [Planctomycetota bacterium]